MTLAAALETPIEHCGQITGEERLLIGLRLRERSCAVARDGIRARPPGIPDVEGGEQLKETLRLTDAQWPI